MSISLRGIAKTKEALLKASFEAEKAAPIATRVSGEIVQKQMIVRAPRDTGRLISLISTESSSAGEGATTKVGSDVPYDRFVQNGTRYMAAQPYGEQAAAASVPGIIASMTGVFKTAIEG